MYQQARIGELAARAGRSVADAIEHGSGRTVNMETGILRQILEKAKLFTVLTDYPKPFPEQVREVGKALDPDVKPTYSGVASSRLTGWWRTAPPSSLRIRRVGVLN